VPLRGLSLARSATGGFCLYLGWTRESDEHAQQLSRLKEMIVDARQDAEKAGVTFIPIVDYPIDWSI
jgi:hypothetical protein